MATEGQEAGTFPAQSGTPSGDSAQSLNFDPEYSRTASNRTTFWLVALVAAVLLVYPAVRWQMHRSGESAVPGKPGSAALQRSLLLYQAKRYEQAVAAAQKAIAADPNLADAYNNLAVSYLGLGKFDKALEAAQSAIRLRPDSALAKNNLAWIQREKAAANPAAPSPSPAAQPAPATALIEQSLQYARAQRFQDCVDAAKQAVQLNPHAAAAHNNLGFCSASLKLWDDAIHHTEEALRLDPTMTIAHNNLVWMRQEKLKASGSQER